MEDGVVGSATRVGSDGAVLLRFGRGIVVRVWADVDVYFCWFWVDT